jgi:hypothetical protein
VITVPAFGPGASRGELDDHLPGLGVADGVVHSFLGDPVELEGSQVVLDGEAARAAEGAGHLEKLGDGLGQFPQGNGQAAGFADHRNQAAGDGAGLVERVLEDLLEVAEFGGGRQDLF